jgi:hypothetical protein
MLQSASMMRRALAGPGKPTPEASVSNRSMGATALLTESSFTSGTGRHFSGEMQMVGRIHSTASNFYGGGLPRQGVDNAAILTPNSPASSHKAIKACILLIVRQFVQLYGPLVLLFDNLHDFDSLSWQLLSKVDDSVMLVGTRRPASKRRETADKRAALVQRVAETCAGHLVKQSTTLHLILEPFDLDQTRELMKVWAQVLKNDYYYSRNAMPPQ